MIIGLDIGTSSTKAVAFDRAGNVLSQHSIPYSILNPSEGYYEQDPEVIYSACIGSIAHVMDDIKEISREIRSPLCISVSSAMHGLIAVDLLGNPLTNCIIWADRRSEDIAVNLQASADGSLIYQQTGTPIHPMSLLCKLMWMKSNNKDVFEKAHKFIGIKELLFYRLFGV